MMKLGAAVSHLRYIGTPYAHDSEESHEIQRLLEDLDSPTATYHDFDIMIIEFCDQNLKTEATPDIKLQKFLTYIETTDLDPRLRQRLKKTLSQKYFRGKAEAFLQRIEQSPGPQGWPSPAEINYAEVAIANAKKFGTAIQDLEMRYAALDLPNKPSTMTTEEFKHWKKRNRQPAKFFSGAVNLVLNRAA